MLRSSFTMRCLSNVSLPYSWSLRGEPSSAVVADLKAGRAETNVLRFSVLLLQLLLATGAFAVLRLEEPTFVVMMVSVVVGFVVNYWLPFAWKERFLVVYSLAMAFILLDYRVAILVVIIGFGVYAIAVSPIPFKARVALIVA